MFLFLEGGHIICFTRDLRLSSVIVEHLADSVCLLRKKKYIKYFPLEWLFEKCHFSFPFPLICSKIEWHHACCDREITIFSMSTTSCWSVETAILLLSLMYSFTEYVEKHLWTSCMLNANLMGALAYFNSRILFDSVIYFCIFILICLSMLFTFVFIY